MFLPNYLLIINRISTLLIRNILSDKYNTNRKLINTNSYWKVNSSIDLLYEDVEVDYFYKELNIVIGTLNYTKK